MKGYRGGSREKTKYMPYHSNGSEYRATPVDSNGIPCRWWRRPKVRKPAVVREVLEFTAGGKHVRCTTEDGRMIRKPLGSVPRHLLADRLIEILFDTEAAQKSDVKQALALM